MTTKEAAAELGVTPDRIRAMIADGRIKAVHRPRVGVGGMEWAISYDEVAAQKNRRKRGRPKYDQTTPGAM